MEIERWNPEYIFIENRVRLSLQDRRDFIKWLWDNEPESFAHVLMNTDERMARIMKEKPGKELTDILEWCAQHKPKLLLSYVNMAENVR